MLDLLHSFFISGPFIPHGHCYLWNKGLVWLHLLSDVSIALAYYSIPLTLVYFVQKRKDLPFNWIFWLFSIFIVACGTTHLMAVWTLWHPNYWVSGLIKAITAIASVYTAMMIFPLVPQALALPSPAEFHSASEQLQTQMYERQQAESALRQAYDELEHRVQERTTDLANANEALRAQVIERQRTEAKLKEVLTLQRAILDSANYTIISTTVDGTITTFNKAAERLLGYTAAEVIGKTSPIIIHERDEVIQRSRELLQELGVSIAPGFEVFVAKARLGEPDEQEWSCIRKDGSSFPLLLSVTALRNAENQKVTGFLGIGSDITERKCAEEELRWKETLLRTMADASPLAFLVVDNRTDAILYFNHRFCEIWGIEHLEEQMQRDELKNNDIIPSCLRVLADVSAFVESCKPLQTEENRIVIEDEIPFTDGRIIRRFSGQIRDEADRYFGRLYLFEDITERKRTETELRQQNARSQLFSEVTLNIRQSLTIDTILETTVTEVQRILQADRVLIFQLRSDGSGTVVQEAVVPGFPVTLGQNIVEPCFQQGYLEKYCQGRVSAITNLEQSDIQPCHVEFLQQFGVKANLVVPILVRNDLWGLLIAHQCTQPRQWSTFESELLKQLANQMGIALSQANLLEQEIRQREELARSEEELRTMSQALESAVEGISQLDLQGRYITVNPAYASMVGYQPEELIGIDWQLTVYPDDLEEMSNAYQQMLTQGKVEVEVRAVRKDGSVFDKQVTMIKAFDPQQQFIGSYCFMKDISERREIERLKDEFISVVSHELRTPLTSISAALDLLAGGVLQSQPEEAQRMLNIAANNTDRLVRLINDILDIERIESGKITMTKQTCNIADLMTQSIEVMQEMAEQASIQLVVEPLSVQLWADSDRIIQVFTNLLSNAIKFSPTGSTVWLTAELKQNEQSVFDLPPSYVLFKVQDQGRGIPADKLESIFERFQQVDTSDSRQRGGTGLGLAICRSILQQHGGQIWATSVPGAGSTFFFTLPISNGSSPQAIASDLSATPTAPLILECDDDSSVRAVVQALLERQGYRVLTAASGQEAVEQAAQQHPAAILLNLMMPGMNGWETLAALRQQCDTQSIPVIILSGVLPDPKVPHPDVSDWIVKPPDPKRLYQALERALAKQNQKIRVLIVEDDRDLAQVLSTLFTRHGIATHCAQTGREAIQLSQQITPDLLVLDLGLPEYDGFAVVDWLQQHNHLRAVPLVVYTARDLSANDRDRLRLGETLILTKGRISPQEFEQRVIQLLNRMFQTKQGESDHDSPPHSDCR